MSILPNGRRRILPTSDCHGGCVRATPGGACRFPRSHYHTDAGNQRVISRMCFYVNRLLAKPKSPSKDCCAASRRRTSRLKWLGNRWREPESMAASTLTLTRGWQGRWRCRTSRRPDCIVPGLSRCSRAWPRLIGPLCERLIVFVHNYS